MDKMSNQHESKDQLVQRDEKYVVHGGGYSPFILVEGKGAVVKDIDGKEYIDCIAGAAGTAWVGHANPFVIEAVKKNFHTLGIYGLGNVNLERIKLAEKLATILPKGINKLFVGIGGTDAISTALKAAHMITGKREAIGLYFSYHGFSMDLISLGGACVAAPELKKALPIMPGYRQIPPPYCYRYPCGKQYPDCDFECARALESAIKNGSHNDVAAFIMEPILGNSGMIMPPSKEYGKIIRETCDKYGILIIADEVQTCLGRTGHMWGCETVGLDPDIICMGKGFGGGLPVSATVFREDLLSRDLMRDRWWQAFSGSGAPILCAAARAVVDFVVREDAPGKAKKMGEHVGTRLKELQKSYDIVGDVRGAGLYFGMELVKDRKSKTPATEEAAKIGSECLENGVIVETYPWLNYVHVKPSFVITQAQADAVVDTLDAAIGTVCPRKP